MSNNTLPTNLPTMINYLLNLGAEVTGSHFFNTSGPTSDYDFFIADTKQNRVAIIEKGGFAIQSETSYADTLTTLVARRYFGRLKNTFTQQWIDVQFVTDVQLKEDAQEYFLKQNINPTRVH